MVIIPVHDNRLEVRFTETRHNWHFPEDGFDPWTNDLDFDLPFQIVTGHWDIFDLDLFRFISIGRQVSEILGRQVGASLLEPLQLRVS